MVLKRSTTKKNKTTGAEGVRHRVFLALALSAYTVPALLALLEGDSQVQGLDTSITNASASAASTAATGKDTNHQAIVKATSDSSSGSGNSSGSSSALFVSGVVNNVDPGTGLISVRLDDGRLAALHKHQLADFATTADVLFSSSATATATSNGNSNGNGTNSGGNYAVGTRVEKALVMAVSKRVVALSLKPLLLAAAAAGAASGDANATTGGSMTMSCPSKVTELVPGQLVAGYIVKVGRDMIMFIWVVNELLSPFLSPHLTTLISTNTITTM